MNASMTATAPRRVLLSVAALVGLTLLAGCGELEPVEWTRASSTTATTEIDLSTTTMPDGEDGEPRRARYTVQEGDTIGSIAAELGVSQDALMAANGIDDPSRLEAGAELMIPGPDATTPAPWLDDDGSTADG